MEISFIALTVIYDAAFYVFPNNPEDSFILQLLSFIIMLSMNITAFIVLNRLFKKMLANKPLQQEIQSMLSGFFLILSSFLFILRQFNWFSYNGFLVNFILMLLAFCFIAYGFRKRYLYIRRTGLYLSFFVCAKLFFIDLFSLDTLGKIISFIVIGSISLAISYSYQRINKKIEKEAENSHDALHTR